MSWVDLVYKGNMWHIELKWEKGNLYFSKKWSIFAKASSLSEGHTCLFITTLHSQKFDMAIYQKEESPLFNYSGKFIFLFC